MCAFWRPFDASDNDEDFAKSFADQTNQKQKRFRIGKKEKENGFLPKERRSME